MKITQLKRIGAVIFCTLCAYVVTAQQIAFPGAEGAGRFTSGGRGTASVPTTVFEVTHLKDDNTVGSLRYALTQTATHRTIVFRVSGTIYLTSKLNIRGNTTIAGQTAPGAGICLADYPVVISGDNVILRYIRCRMGDKNQLKTSPANCGVPVAPFTPACMPLDGSGGDDALGNLGNKNIIIDHCSVSWSNDEALTIYRGDSVTLQWNIISEPLNYSYHFETGDTDFQNHGYGGIWGSLHGSFHHNLFAHCRNRNPRFAGNSSYPAGSVESADFRNNVIYNWGINTVYGGDGGEYNLVNNYYKYGPNTSSGVRYRIVGVDSSVQFGYAKYFISGNHVDGSTSNTNSNWLGASMNTGIAADTIKSKSSTPFLSAYLSGTTHTAQQAYDMVLQYAGASLRRDTLDERIANDVRNRTGKIIDVQGGFPHGTPYANTVNAWPALVSTPPPTDTDRDGMSDAWEIANGLNPNNASDRGIFASNGYTHLENYLNSIITADQGQVIPPAYDVVVAKNGTGNYTSLQDAINASPNNRTTPWKIFIKKGKYVEPVVIPSNKPFLQLIGENMAETIISFDNYSGKANPAGGTFGTSTCGTMIINAADVMLMNLSVENATGYGINANAIVPAPGDGPQAVAVYTTSDRVVFFNCRMNGGQDTYYGGNNRGTRVYMKNSYIDGNTDFIFGSSTIIFDTCIIYPRTRLDNGTGGFVTAANTKAESAYGYVFRDCKITKNRGITLYTLGRPWQNDAGTADAAKSYNKTVFLNSFMGASIRPEGWSVWDAGTNTSFITYAEYNTKNYDGTSKNLSGRVSWSKQLTAAEATKYYNNDTVFINANRPAMPAWNPYSTWPELNTRFVPELSASNLLVRRPSVSSTTANVTWNISWPMAGIQCDLYRSSDKQNFSLINTQYSSEDSAANFSYTDNVPSAGNTYYYLVRMSKAGFSSTTSDTATISSKPLITVTAALSDFLQGIGTPSSTQGYVVSGLNILDSIKIQPPVHYEVSANGGTTWFNNTTPLGLKPTNGIVANTNITLRLNGTVVGTFNNNIIHSATLADTVKTPLRGTIQAQPVQASAVLQHWPLTQNNQDSAAIRSVGVVASAPTFRKFAVADSLLAPYSPTRGQVFAATSKGLWTTAEGGPGGNLNRTNYEQFTITAATGYSIRVDSLKLNTAFYASASNIKLAVVYSRSGFTTDSTEVVGYEFATQKPLTQDNNSPSALYVFPLNGSTGVTLSEGQTISIRLYFTCGSTSPGRFAQLKDVIAKGTATQNTTTSVRDNFVPAGFSVYPNPTVNKLYIKHPRSNTKTNISMYSLLGVKVGEWKAKPNLVLSALDVESLPPGQYFIHYQSGKQTVVLKCMVAD